MCVAIVLSTLGSAAARGHPDGILMGLAGGKPGDRYGSALAGLGDLDGDGRADFAVGAPGASPNGPGSGRVEVISGREGRVLHALVGSTSAERFGSALAGLGDVDGDGVGDLAVGSPRYQGSRGRVQVFSGSSGALLWSASGGAGGARFGEVLAAVGDLDGDGRVDLAIGAPFSSAAGTASGRVEVRSGASGALLLTFDGGPFDLFGSAIAAAGDADGDGVPDLWIGAPLTDATFFNAGSAYLRSGQDGSLLATQHGAEVGAQLGQWIAGVGDFDGDGRSDWALASPGADANGIDAGRVEVRSGASGALLLRRDGSVAGSQIGPLAGIGDIDGDGRPEILIGDPVGGDAGPRPGRAYVLRGELALPAHTLLGRRSNDWFGAALANLGDVDGDGVPDFGVGAPGHEDEPTHTGYVQVYSGRRLAGTF